MISLLVIQSSYAQTDAAYLKTSLEQLHQKLEDYVSNSPNDQKLDRMTQSHYWLHALAAYSNLGTLSIYEPIDKLDDEEKAAYDNLSAHIAAFTAAPKADKNAATEAEKFVSGLKVLKKQFIVAPPKPLYYFLEKDELLSITFNGDFPALLQDTAYTYIYAGNNKVGFSNATDSTITFIFTAAQLGLNNALPLTTTNVKLHLVGQLGKKINPRRQFLAIYDFYALSLPTSPGKLTITKNSTASNIEKQTKRTRTFLLNGSKGNLVEKQCIPSHDGWSVVPESVTLVIESSKGTKNRDWNYRKTSSGGKTCYTAEVFYNSSGTSGKLEYHIKYDIKRSTTEETSDTDEIMLTWGQIVQQNFDMAIVQIVYTDFMGTPILITDGSFQSFWLQLKQEKNSIAIKTPDISTLNTQP